MEKIRVSKLEPGKAYELSLFTLAGQKLLNAGVTLTERHLELINRQGDMEVFAAHDIAELVIEGVVKKVDSSSVKVGKKSEEGLISASGQVIVEAGEEIEGHHIEAMNAAGGAFASKEQKQQQRRERILMGDALVETLEAQAPKLTLRVTPEASTSWLTKTAEPWPAEAKLSESRKAGVDLLRKYFAMIEAGVSVKLSVFDPLIDELLDRLSKYPTRFTQLPQGTPKQDDYLPDHAYSVATFAMAIGFQLKWPRENVREVGQAALLYDLGMLLVPERIRTGASQLSEIDRSRVRRHPTFSLAMLQAVEGVPPILQLAALQHHERENGTGYPRGCRKEAMCDYARVLAVADTFAATIAQRHYRKPKLPYIAMEETIRSTSGMTFWKPAVRALLQAAGLFPVGSFVKLSTGKSAYVVSANPAHLDRPSVQLFDAEGKATPEVIDLSTMPAATLAVVRPLMNAAG